LPVDDEINLDNPEGISKEDIDRMVEQADELERIAYTSEKNAETVKKNLKVFENKSFKEINAMTGEATNLNIGDDTDIREKIAEIYEFMDEAKRERQENLDEINKNKVKLSEADIERARILKQFESMSGEVRNVYGQVSSFRGNPLGFGMGKIKGLLGKAGIYGAVAMVAWEMGESMYNQIMTEIKNQFKAGGVYDTRKIVEDQINEYNSIAYLSKIKSGQIIFTADAGQDLVQGQTDGAYNTRNLVDGHLRFIQLRAGI
jgi:hypothetical protein|tara:strand:- start:1593 stop:2372 length:780 start_codon:yes stop_codon:yes gene_type:complete